MVEVVEQFVEFVPRFKTFSSGNNLMVRFIKRSGEPSKHSANRKLILVMSVERSWIENNWKIDNKGEINQNFQLSFFRFSKGKTLQMLIEQFFKVVIQACF